MKKINAMTLEELIPLYAECKEKADEYTKKCKEQNAQIKALMTAQGLTNAAYGGVEVKKVVQHKDTFDEAKLLKIVKEINGGDKLVRTKEYVDMDALENAIYNADIVKADLIKINECKVEKVVETLRIGKAKNGGSN